MTEHDLIQKYISRIMTDYPEPDKIYIDLKQFAAELKHISPEPNPEHKPIHIFDE